MQQNAKTLKFAIVIGTATAILLMSSMVRLVGPKAEATPAIGQGKACNTCHTSSTPSKNDLKK